MNTIDSPQLERRHLTVLECDLVGSTALADRLDPEELRDLILAYQDKVLFWVEKLDGYFVQFAGDAIWVYFGYPVAHEDDACRAIRAGLGMSKTVSSIKLYGESLRVRVGIASGLCVVGRLRQTVNRDKQNVYGHEMNNQITAIGNPPNLAARLQTLVKPGAVAVAEETRSLAGKLFEFEDLGIHKIKGFTKKVQAWRVVSENDEQSRFRALRPGIQTPLIGRQLEIKKITGLWRETCKSHGQVVFLSGDPGIGKSRLVESIAEDIIGRDYPQWWLHCSEHLQGSAFAPLITLIQSQAGFTDTDGMQTRFEKLQQRYPDLKDDALGVLADLLSIEESCNSTVQHMSPSRRREYLYEVLIELIEAVCEKEPLLLVAEDTHWIDPSTQSLLQRLTLRSTNLTLLMLITSRTVNENDNSFLELVHVHSLNIEQLQRDDCFTLLNALWDEDEVPMPVAEQIVDKTDGVPLFIEDVIFTLRHHPEDAQGPALKKKITVPTKLSEHLMSRIDKLGESKHIAQIAAVAGRKFPLALLEILTGLSAPTLKNKMETLISAGLVITSEQDDESNFIFKHAMIRDAAYDSLLISEREELHSRIANWLEKGRATLAQSLPETIACHYENAGAFDLAVKYWMEAGQRSNSRSHYAEASIHLGKAYKLIPKLAGSIRRDRVELDVITAMGVAHAGTGGISGEDVGKIYDKARQLCISLDYPAEIFTILSGAGAFHFIRSEYDKARGVATQSIQLATEKSNPTGEIIGKRILGAVQFVTCEFDSAINSLESAIHIYDEDAKYRRSDTLAYALDHKTTALCYLALTNLVIGRTDFALETSRRSVSHSDDINLHSMNCALCYQAAIRHLREEPADVILDVATHSFELALEEGYASWAGMSRLIKGDAIIQLGQLEEGIREVRQGVIEHGNVMAQTFLPLAQSILAKGLIATRQLD